MFALAVADSSVCVCALFVLLFGDSDPVTMLPLSSIIDDIFCVSSGVCIDRASYCC